MRFILSLLAALILSMPLAVTAEPSSKLYPVEVCELSKNGTKQIIKTYELADDENPDNIPQDSFYQGDFIFELADITKKENVSTNVKEFKKSVSINTNTKDLGTVIKKFDTSIEYNDDGYTGTLNLNTRNIQIKTAGTKNESYTISSVREYPNLSSNDASLVPKTIDDKGTVMTLSKIDWKTQYLSSVDYQELPDSYTAVASYTGTAYRTVATGYIATAEYKGTISKTITGKTTYNAVFKGTKVLNNETNIVENTSISDNMKGGDAGSENLTGRFISFVILFSLLGGGIGIAFLLFLKRRKDKKISAVENESSQEFEDTEKEESEL